jgi:hypothetical protein
VPNKPKKAEYVLACTAVTATSTSSTVEQILELLDAKAAFAPQGRLTITLENHNDPDAGTDPTAG